MTTISDFLRGKGLLNEVTTSPTNHNFMNQVVQFDDDPNNVASGEATIIFSGPPVYGKKLGTKASFADCLVPIGAVQGFQDNETPNIQPFPEIGSRLKRMAVGMANYQVSISRVITYHSNLRNALYAWISKDDTINNLQFRQKPGSKDTDNKGDGHIITSESEITRVPFGLLLATVSAGGGVICQEYYEKCYLQNVGKGVQAGSGMIQENVSIFATRKVPASETIGTPLTATDTYIFREGKPY